MNLKEMKGRMKLISDRLGALARQETRTEAEESELDQLMAEMNDIGPQIERLHAAEQAATKAATLATPQSAGRVSSIVSPTEQHGTEGGAEQQANQSLFERFHAEVAKDYLANGARGKSKSLKTGSLLSPKFEAAGYQTYSGQGPVDRLALVNSAGQSATFLMPPHVLPTIYRPTDDIRTMRSLLINGRTTADQIFFLRELLFTNAAAEVAEATATAGASGLKPESSLTFEEDSSPVVTIAHWIPITRQAIADAAQLQTYVEDRLLVGLEQRFNGQLLNGAGGGTNMTGILNTTGVQAADAAYFAGDPVKNAGTDLEPFDRLARAKRLVRTVGKARGSFIVLSPEDLELLMTTTDANDRYYGLGPFSAGGVTTIWGLPVAEEEELAAGTALVGDGTMAAIWDREDGNVMMDTIDDQFVRNMITLLAEMRAALTVFRPAAFVEVELGTV